jgi:GNAT superfamily N-acetyltransferase
MMEYYFNLKLADKSDFDKIAKIYVDEFSKEPFNEPWTFKFALGKLGIFSRYCDIWKIVFKEGIIGFLVINPNHWFLGETIFGEEMAVSEEFQGKGIGENAVLEILEIYKKKGYKKYMCLVNKKSKSFGLQKKIGVEESQFDKLMWRKL